MAEQLIKIWVTPPLPGGVKIRHVGYLDLTEFYVWLQRWFEFQGYFKEDKDFEEFYEQRILPKGEEMHIRWKGFKEENPYFTYYIEVIWLLVGINKVEVPMGDKKRKIHQGDFELRIGAYIVKKGPSGFLRKIYEYFIMRKVIEEHKFKLYDKFYSLHDEIKSYFDQYVQ